MLKHGYPRLANQLQVCCGGERVRLLIDDLHNYDLAVIEADLVHSMPEYLGIDGILRSRNPNLVLLTYFSGADVNPYYRQPIQEDFVSSMKDSWYLHDVEGKQVPFYQLSDSRWTLAQNPSTPANEFLPRYLSEKVLQTGLIDGIFYDWAFTHISWINHRKNKVSAPIDIDNDGKEDSDEKIDEVWTSGYLKMLKNSRKDFPVGTVILGNGGWNTGPKYSNVLNGIMIEQFTEGEKGNPDLYGWRALMRTYSYYERKSLAPHLSMIMANDDSPENVSLMRFALCSTLMFDGYFCFTNTNKMGAYRSNRWYDEYSVVLSSGHSKKNPEYKGYLGNPLSKAYDALNPKHDLQSAVQSKGNHAEERIWRRDFENGIVLVNPDTKEQKIELHGTFRKIRGTFDPKFNDGSVLSSLVMPPREGAILLRTAETH